MRVRAARHSSDRAEFWAVLRTAGAGTTGAATPQADRKLRAPPRQLCWVARLWRDLCSRRSPDRWEHCPPSLLRPSPSLRRFGRPVRTSGAHITQDPDPRFPKHPNQFPAFRHTGERRYPARSTEFVHAAWR